MIITYIIIALSSALLGWLMGSYWTSARWHQYHHEEMDKADTKYRQWKQWLIEHYGKPINKSDNNPKDYRDRPEMEVQYNDDLRTESGC